ncbi:SDR family NAD(P)-dependent oxidoreductase [Streptomyces sp. NPDC000594]|uniref:type I polyketide synthase n=1 Tax=Streptomyces sp. NPDC000594 TaxID=3154261 RepID=UPI00332BAAE8
MDHPDAYRTPAPLPDEEPAPEPAGATGLEIAVIGLACRFPGAPDATAFWRNLSTGTESITVFTREELVAAGVPAVHLDDPDYVPAQGVLDGADLFDAPFFGYSPKEADLLDPQQRVLLECAWTALEDAGYDPRNAPGPVGVYAGSYYGSYLAQLTAGAADPHDTAEEFARNLANEKDYLATRIAYKLDLDGPALTVQTACSTSLVAVHLACQALLSGDCEMALAGGATVRARQAGYVHQPGGIFSSDGHCRPFDARAEGTVASNGAGIVVLKRLEDALADGDPVRAVIKGSAVGNDAARRVGFTAPGAAGQARVIAAAYEAAEVSPATVSYVETHGSGTPVGDPIEIQALTRVFAADGATPGSCAIGAVKSNIGHTHVASGIAGFIKTVLALQHREIPPSLHFDKPNPDIDFDATPFFVNTRPRPWEAGEGPRRAGVSSFGMGGTDAHVVLEEAPGAEGTPAPEPVSPGERRQLLPLSARTPEALETATDRLAGHLADHSGTTPLAATARTLQTGRRPFPYRRFVVARDHGGAAEALRDPRALRGGHHDGSPPAIAFLLPGLGEQRPGMGRELYDTEPEFRAAVDRCALALVPHLGIDLRTLMYPAEAATGPASGPASGGDGTPDLRRLLGRGPRTEQPASPLDRTLYAQPATFVVEYALGVLWQSWGIRPDALIGYSIGEYAAACLAGVVSLDDALRLIAHRARLIEEVPGGAMLAVPLPEEEIRPLLGDGPGGLSFAAVNGDRLCVVAGETDRIAALAERLGADEVAVRRLRTTHAFHSHMMEPVVARFTELVAGVELSAPHTPYVSNVTGDWITPEQATSPAFWGRHLRETVRFGDGVRRLWQTDDRLLLEIGPGQSLSSLALQARPPATGPDGRETARPAAYASLPGEYDRQSEAGFFLTTAGKLWAAGAELDWTAVRGGATPPKEPLPTYPFERRRHWIDAVPTTPGTAAATAAAAPSLARKDDIADWFTVPLWEPIAPHPRTPGGGTEPADWLLFADTQGTGDTRSTGDALAERLTRAGHRVTLVRPGTTWHRGEDGTYTIAPGSDDDHRRLVADLDERDRRPAHVVHLWTVGPRTDADTTLEHGFGSLLRLNRATASRWAGEALDIAVVTSDAHAVLGTERTAPEKATATGPCLVLPLEQPDTVCRGIDISLPSVSDAAPAAPDLTVDHLLAELLHPSGHALTALRGRGRWTTGHRPLRLDPLPGGAGGATGDALPAPDAVWLITGGFGGIGLALARHLAERGPVRLVLVGRSPLPPRDTWDDLLAGADTDSDSDNGSDSGSGAVDRIRAVRALEALGAEVLPVAADVTDAARLDEAADEAVRRFGAVHAIVHAAGVPAAGLAQLKDDETARRVLAPKVRGALAVDAVARRLGTSVTVLCSSTLALTGGPGQIDYVAANAFLDALAHHNDLTGGPRTVSVNWDGWRDVGMAARLIGTHRSRTGPVDHPLLEACLSDDEERAVYAVSLSVAGSWLIDEHRMEGSAVVPGTGHLELVRAAHAHQRGGPGIELRDVTFLSPVVIGDDQRRELRIILDKEPGGGDTAPMRFTVVSRPVPEDATPPGTGTGTRTGTGSGYEEGWHAHVTGEAAPLTDPPAPVRHDLAALIADGGLRDLGAIEHTGPMGFGGRSRCLRRVHLGDHGALAELELPAEFAGDLEHIALHPSLLDLGAGFHGMNLAQEFRIPLSYGRLTLLAPLTRRIYSHHRFQETDRPGKETFTVDFTLLDEDGNELVRVENFLLKRVTRLKDRLESLRDGTSAEVAPYRPPAPRATPRTQGGDAGLGEHLAQGIRPHEGVDALLRVLAADPGPRIAIVAKDLDAVIADIARGRDRTDEDDPATAGADGSATGAAHPRPRLTTAYRAPGDPVEERLAGLWSALLGVQDIGVHDDFFELGGHSLLGVQLLARVRRELGVDLPLNALFEALTVDRLADVVRPLLPAPVAAAVAAAASAP